MLIVRPVDADFLGEQQADQLHQFTQVADDRVGTVRMPGRAGEDLVQPRLIPAGAVVEDRSDAGGVGGDHVGGAVADVPAMRAGGSVKIFQRAQEQVRRRFPMLHVVAAHHRVEEIVPARAVDDGQLVFHEIAIAVGDDTEDQAQAAQALEMTASVGFQGMHLADELTVSAVEGLVGDRLGGLVGAEQHLEDVRARDLALGRDGRVQPAIIAHVLDELGILQRLGVLRQDQSFPQTQFVQAGQHLVDRVVHGVMGIDQRGMPVNQNDIGPGMGQLQDAHGSV